MKSLFNSFSLRPHYVVHGRDSAPALFGEMEAILESLEGCDNAEAKKLQAKEKHRSLAQEFEMHVREIVVRHHGEILASSGEFRMDIKINKAGAAELKKLDPDHYLVAPPFRNKWINI